MLDWVVLVVDVRKKMPYEYARTVRTSGKVANAGNAEELVEVFDAAGMTVSGGAGKVMSQIKWSTTIMFNAVLHDMETFSMLNISR